MNILHFGTFDVANYGDLLLPLVVERRLRELDESVEHVSPVGGPPMWSDCRATVSVLSVRDRTDQPGGIMVGGGNILHAGVTSLADYGSCRESSLLAYPSLWLVPSQLSLRWGIPCLWNAPAVPSEFAPRSGALASWAADQAEYLAVRDQTSRQRLVRAGVRRDIAVVHDTALDVRHLWSADELDVAYARVFERSQRRPPGRTLAVHLSRRNIGDGPESIAARLDSLCDEQSATVILIALEPCHGDDEILRRVAKHMKRRPLCMDRPRSLCEVVACIARAEAYLGSSLHGLITACALGRRAMIVSEHGAAPESKFVGFLAPFVLERWIVDSWTAAAGATREFFETAIDPWRQVAAAADPLLEEHWRRVREILGERRTQPPRSGTRDTAALPASEQAWDRLAADPLFFPILLEQASRVAEAFATRRELDRARRQLHRSVAAHDRAQRETASRYAALKEQSHARVRDLEHAAARSRREIRQLEGWMTQLRAGVDSLLASRRWRVADRLGHAWQIARGRPRVFYATEVLSAIYDRFEAWRASAVAPVKKDEQKLAPSRVEANMHANVPVTLDAKLDGLSVDIGVCVHNALEATTSCLEAVVRTTQRPYRLILVDDGSQAECRDYLARFAASHANCVLLRNDSAVGYTRAANRGLRASTASYVVLLNSDTLVTTGWLEKLLACGESDARIGLVGPLSNAASWQSVPRRFTRDGDWAINRLPASWTADHMARRIEALSQRRFPRVPLLNGFCLVVKRAVIETIGLFDEQAFPRGYGEENDYCLRATDRGFRLAIADHAYVYHDKSRSYSHESRRRLSKRGAKVLRRIYGASRLRDCTATMRDEPTLAAMRRALGDLRVNGGGPARADNEMLPRILFVLPVRGGGGGAHSVVQDVIGMRKLGADARIAIKGHHLGYYRHDYPWIEQFDDVFCTCDTQDELLALSGTSDIVVGTIFTSMPLVKRIVDLQPRVMPAYYVQDYEPFFFAPGSAERRAAAASYTLAPGALVLAKTEWLCGELLRRHAIVARKIVPSLDSDVFLPAFSRISADRPVRVCAMVRPATPRRGARRTMRVFKRLADQLGTRAQIDVFGSSAESLAAHQLQRDFPFHHHGVLIREEVADLLRRSDVFVDLSDYQAFGRTGLEAMACGCAVIVPRRGGCGEYAVHGVNALVVDTASEDACLEALTECVVDVDLRSRLRSEGIKKAAEYSIHRAALSELSAFVEYWTAERKSRSAEAGDSRPLDQWGASLAGSDRNFTLPADSRMR